MQAMLQSSVCVAVLVIGIGAVWADDAYRPEKNG
jgi:hypothetical protein